MIKRLNGWQQLWVIFAGVLLASTIALAAAAWPQRQPGIVADLRAPECKVWREIPEGVFPGEYPASTGQCYSIRSFLYDQRVTVRSEEEYDRFLTRTGAKTALTFLATWAGLSLGVYILAWSTSGLVARALVKRRQRNVI